MLITVNLVINILTNRLLEITASARIQVKVIHFMVLMFLFILKHAGYV